MLLAAYTDAESMGPVSLARPLSLYRQARLESMRVPENRRQGIAAERLLEQLLTQCRPSFAPPAEILTDESGKPQLAGEWGLSFNLSHSGRYAACVVADHPVGIDIQCVSSCRQAVVRRCFTREECAYLNSCPDRDRAFTQLWAIKESYIKLIGRGLRHPMNAFSVTVLRDEAQASSQDARFWFSDLEDAVLAVCVPTGREPKPLRLQRIDLP